MNSALIRATARELLNLTLTDAAAARLVGPVIELHKLVEEIETVALPYCADPFISPRVGDAWLEAWRGE